MTTQVVINGSTYNVPEQGTNPAWGNDLNSVIVALATALNSVSGSSDVQLTSFNLANGQESPASITGLNFDTTQVRSAIISYSVYISTSSVELSEVGNIYVTYKSSAGVWDISQHYGGSSGIVFSITNAGQIQYTSTSVAGSSYSGKIKFSAKAFLQT